MTSHVAKRLFRQPFLVQSQLVQELDPCDFGDPLRDASHITDTGKRSTYKVSHSCQLIQTPSTSHGNWQLVLCKMRNQTSLRYGKSSMQAYHALSTALCKRVVGCIQALRGKRSPRKPQRRLFRLKQLWLAETVTYIPEGRCHDFQVEGYEVPTPNREQISTMFF